MTKSNMDLSELLQKHDQGDLLRSIAEAALQLIMEADVDGLIGAGRHERSGDRTTRRNGYRDRALDTRLGTLNLRVPKLRQGSSIFRRLRFVRADCGRLATVPYLMHERLAFRDRRLGPFALRRHLACLPERKHQKVDLATYLEASIYFRALLEASKTTEQAMVEVNREAWISGVSTRRVDELLQPRDCAASRRARHRSPART